MSNLQSELKRQFLYKQALAKITKIDKALDKINASRQKKAA